MYNEMDVSFGRKKKKGTIVAIPAGYISSTPMTGKTWKFKMNIDRRVMVQAYDVDQSKGMMVGDVTQNGKFITISFDKDKTGYAVIVIPKAELDVTVPSKHWELQHNLGRLVCAQVYLDGTGQAMGDVHNVDENTVTVDFNKPMTGYLLVA